ncbi:MAG: hypothetical protein ACREEJ_12600 [Ensifer adhaerens]
MLDWLPSEWFAAISTSTITAIAGFVIGTFYKAKVEKSVQHNLDRKLESLRTTLRNEEEVLKSELRAKGEQIAALRNGALSGLANRQAAIDKRRLEAIDKLWSATVRQAQFKSAVKMTASIKMEVALVEAAKQDAEGAKLRNFATVIWQMAGLDNVKPGDPPDSERPFLPPLLWALYSAYSQVITLPLAQLAAMRAGTGPELLADPKPMIDLVKTALPHQAVVLDEHGAVALPYLIDELEEAILKEIRQCLSNPDGDQSSVEQAAAILKAADTLADTSKKSVEPPAGIV